MVKQRLSTADVAAEVACLRQRIMGMRVANVYDINPKVSEGGCRCPDSAGTLPPASLPRQAGRHPGGAQLSPSLLLCLPPRLLLHHLATRFAAPARRTS